MSMPFVDRVFTFTQPDGTKLQVRGTGNQHRATFTTFDGHTVMKDPVTGFYHYAEETAAGPPVPGAMRATSVAPDNLTLARAVQPPPTAGGLATFVSIGLPHSPSRWEIRRQQRRIQGLAAMANGIVAPAPPQRQTVGTFVGLCLLIDFPDIKGDLKQADVDDFCNKPGYTGFGNNGSVRDYYFEVSGGKLTYTNTVAPWFTASKPSAYYKDETVPYPTRAQELISEALAYHRAQGLDFSKFTLDNQHYIYAINVFYAGDCTNAWSHGLWPHSWHLPNPMQIAPNILANDYQFTDMSTELSLGTFCHENGHMLCEFPDLYDYNNLACGVGEFCLMCFGADNPKNPARIGAYLRNSAGWASSLTNLTPGASVTLPSGSNEFGILRHNKTEYYIVENREQTGRDVSIPAAGLAIWKVDETHSNNDEGMTATSHYECALVQADGRNDLEMGANRGDPGDLFPQGGTFSATSAPNSNWWDGTASNLNIHGIGAPGPKITFST
jgi:M6 family metalloprotease-like protein